MPVKTGHVQVNFPKGPVDSRLINAGLLMREERPRVITYTININKLHCDVAVQENVLAFTLRVYINHRFTWVYLNTGNLQM